jgi:uncharacterized protein YbjT (DUF2867 family)
VATVLVTGGTGDLGRSVVRRLIEQRDHPRILTRNPNPAVPAGAQLSVGDLVTRNGIDEAIAGADFIVHCASNPLSSSEDLEATSALLELAARHGVQRFVYISIVGVDRPSYPYYELKYKVEQLVMSSSVPSVILRATQFHSFIAGMIQKLVAGSSNEILVPGGVRLQPIAKEEVIGRLLALMRLDQIGLADQIGGPEVLTLEQMVSDYLLTRGTHASLRTVDARSLRDFPWHAWTGDTQLCPQHRYGRLTWQEFLRREKGD